MTFKIEGLSSLIKKIDKIHIEIDRKKKEFLDKLAQVGVETASIIFKTAQYDGINDVEVNSEWLDDSTIRVVAKGKSVTFIEFGTGITYTEQHPLAVDMGMIRGSYGKGRGKNPKWSYYGDPGTHGEIVRVDNIKGNVVLTKGNPPAKALYQAGKDIRERILEVAKEVFS